MVHKYTLLETKLHYFESYRSVLYSQAGRKSGSEYVLSKNDRISSYTFCRYRALEAGSVVGIQLPESPALSIATPEIWPRLGGQRRCVVLLQNSCEQPEKIFRLPVTTPSVYMPFNWCFRLDSGLRRRICNCRLKCSFWDARSVDRL